MNTMNTEFTTFVSDYLPLAEKLAKTKERKYKRLLSSGEVISAAYWGLLKACQKYRSLPSDQFVSIAARCILNEIINAVKAEVRSRKLTGNGDLTSYLFAKKEPDMVLEGQTVKERDVYRLVCCEGLTKTEASQKLGLSRREVQRSLVRLWKITQGDEVDQRRSAC